MLEQGGVFITVQDTGGDFGLTGESGERAWSGGLGALTKTLAREWPEASVKCIDIKCGQQGPDRIAQAIAEELINGGPEIEVGLCPDGERISIDTVSEELTDSIKPLPEGNVVIASGGARGITAACLLALADRSDLKIAILGRTHLADEPDYAAGCKTDAEIRKAIMNNDKLRGLESIPSEISRKVRDIMANREIKATVNRLKEKGSEVRYYPADICDIEKLESVVSEIHTQWGEISILIHGAGIISDSYMHEKTIEQFDNVFKTKVDGFRNLLSATQDDPLTHICCFSSIVARGGNIRQADYAMANEVLNKVCGCESRRRDNGCVVKAINWGPWDAGMVMLQHKLHFESKGYVLIPPAEGTRLFVKEMEAPKSRGPAEIILSGQLGELTQGI
jgi:NAD(P)-dependent dehydrogenase (short-subunit alcohol dehydrogenase family)